jgi:hypothetical protein
MLEFNTKDRDKKAPKGFTNFYSYPALTVFDNTPLFKIGINNQISVKGRFAWNEYCNDGYHKFGLRGNLFDDEAGRIKITEAVEVPKIFDEVLLKVSFKKAKSLEDDLRKLCKAYTFPESINFSGKTEFVYADNNSYIIIEEYFKFLRNNYECR